MARLGKEMGAAAAALLVAAAFAAPSVEVTNVQQQYPWTNTVDITYTVQGVNLTHQTNRTDHIVNDTYFVTFEAKNGNNAIKDVNGNSVFTNALVNGNGTFTAQWQPQTNLQLTGNNITPSVFRGEENAYLVVNLETNKNGRMNWWYEPMSTQDASNMRYNTDFYKTKRLVLRRVSAGTYTIGAEFMRGRGHADVGGNPPHQVVVPSGTCYYFSIFPVTEAQYAYVMGTGNFESKLGETSASWNNVRNSTGPGASILPDAQNQTAFFVRLSGLTGLTFDLPTEEMWEIAARARSTTVYHWGDDFGNGIAYAWCDNEGKQVVGLKLPNNWGIYETAGMFWEWCLDVRNSLLDLSNKTTDIYTPNLDAGGERADGRRHRGGSYSNGRGVMQSPSYRAGYYSANYIGPRFGFRATTIMRNN